MYSAWELLLNCKYNKVHEHSTFLMCLWNQYLKAANFYTYTQELHTSMPVCNPEMETLQAI